MFVGVLLILLGALWLLDEMGIIYGGWGDYIFPVVIIALGVQFIMGARKKHH